MSPATSSRSGSSFLASSVDKTETFCMGRHHEGCYVFCSFGSFWIYIKYSAFKCNSKTDFTAPWGECFRCECKMRRRSHCKSATSSVSHIVHLPSEASSDFLMSQPFKLWPVGISHSLELGWWFWFTVDKKHHSDQKKSAELYVRTNTKPFPKMRLANKIASYFESSQESYHRVQKISASTN